MKITTNWLKDHLETEFNENQIIDKLTDVGLEVESVEKQSDELDSFVVAKIIKAEKHPNADRLRVCDVNIGSGKPVLVKKVITKICSLLNSGKPQYGKIKLRKDEIMKL